MGASQNYNVNLNINANAQSAQQQLQKLQQQLQQISSMKIDVEAGTTKQELQEAAQAALELQMHLKQATNLQTGNLDFTKLSTSLKKSKIDIVDYANTLAKVGPAGQQAFIELAQSVSKAEIPMRRISESTQKMWDGFKRTAGWQLQSSVIHGVVGGVQKALGYAKDLNKSLTDIRIVTGSSAEEMAHFAQRANDAAKKLSTTTTDYTRASLIYYQQGLSDAEVKARTEATIKMANATGTSAQQVSDQMTAIWNNYADGSKSLTHYADVMTALGAATASSTDEIAEGLQKFASISNTVGLSYEYAASALATITSESRESADVVGNALKTLFSRIQGLQLGETLDDGTTLNKYSTALAKVGISIKDQSGGLKDMDDILDEMGSKWDGLARDEKMALAQTVAGVRQYTQLMTLMENWDDFKTNLNTANTSTGTLDRQAAIYADSWEAASNRVRASFEGLWDNLINSDSFINALDAFSSFIDIIDQMISGLGGAKGAFLTFGGILGQVFNKQITGAVSNFAYNIKMLSPKFVKKQQDEQISTLKSFSQAYRAGNLPMGKSESAIRNNIIEQTIKDKQDYWKMAPYLSQTQQEYYNGYSNIIEQNRQARIVNAQEQDALFTKIGDMALGTMQNALEEDYYSGGKMYDEIQKLKSGNRKKNAKAIKEKENEYYGKGNTSEYDRGYASVKESRKGKSTRKTLLNDVATKNANNMAAIEAADSYESTKAVMEEMLKNTGVVGEKANKYFDNILDQFGQDTDRAMKYMKERGAAALADEYRNKVVDDIDLTNDEKKQYKGRESQYREQFKTYAKTIEELKAKERRGEQLTEHEQQLLANQQGAVKNAKIDTTEAVVSGAMGAMQALAAGESLNALINSLGDGTATLTSTLTGMTSALMSGAMGVQGLTKAASAIPGISAHAGKIGLVITAVLGLIAVLSNFAEKAKTTDEEIKKNLGVSDNELQSSVQSTSQEIEKYKTQNEAYFKSVEKIKSISYDPVNISQDIYEANKQALELIEQYGLLSNQYSTDKNGLIEIDKEVLDSKTKEKELTAKEADYANILGKAINDQQYDDINTEKEETAAQNNIEGLLGQAIDNYQNETQTLPESQDKATAYQKWSASQQALSFGNVSQAWVAKTVQGNNEQWDKLVGDFSEVNWDEIEKSLNVFHGLEGDSKYQSPAIQNAAQVITNKILAEKGITSDTQAAYNAYAKNIANQAAKDMADGKYQLLDVAKNDKLTSDQRELIQGYLEKYMGVTGAGQFKSENGNILYKGEGDTEYQHVTRSTINAWYAQEQIQKNFDSYKKQADISWKDSQKYGDAAAEAIANIKESDSIAGASVKSIRDLFYDKDGKKREDWSEEEWAEKANNEYAKIDGLFTNFLKLGDKDNQLISNEVLDKMDFSTLESFANAVNKDSYDSLGGLFEAIQTATGETDSEGLSKIFTALSSFDFGDSAYLNLKNLQSVLEQFGYSIDEGQLPALYEWLTKIVGIGPGETPKNNQDKIMSRQDALNQIAPDEAVDEDTMLASGLSQDKFVENQSGQYVFKGTQEDIDSEKSKTNEALVAEYNQAVTDKAAHDSYVGQGAAESYSDVESFTRAAKGEIKTGEQANFGKKVTGKQANLLLDQLKEKGITYDAEEGLYTETDDQGNVVGTWDINNKDQKKEFQEKVDNLGITDDDGRTVKGKDFSRIINSGTLDDQYLGTEDIIETGGSPEQAEALQLFLEDQGLTKVIEDGRVTSWTDANGNEVTDLTSYMDKYNAMGETPELDLSKNNATDIMNGVRSGLFSDKNGVITDEALNQMLLYADTSERTKTAYDNLVKAKKEYNANPEEGLAAVQEAQYQNDLAQSIEKVAAARGLDAEQVAIQAEAIQSSFTGEINGVKIQGQLTAEAIADMAAEMISASNAATKLKSKSKDLYKNINSKDAAAASSALAELEKDVIALIGAEGDAAKAGPSFRKYLRENQDVVEAAANGNEKALNKLRQAYVDSSIAEGGLLDDVAIAAKNLGRTEDFNNIKSNIAGIGEAISSLQADELWNVGEALTRGLGGVGDTLYNTIDGLMALGPAGQAAAQAIGDAFGFNVTHVDVSAESLAQQNYKGVVGVEGVGGAIDYKQGNEAQALIEQGGTVKIPVITPKAGGGSGKAGGGGGGGGGKEPKKVAQTRRSQVVKRYKNVDAQRAANKNRRDNMSKKTDKLYGESRITNLQRENKLLEEGLRLNEKKAEEALKNLKIDEDSLRKMTKKYGYELELDSEGNITNYEKILGDIYDQIHKLELDGELSEEEEKIKEELEIKKQEIEGAIEDWEDTLKQLEELNNEYEELIDEMHSNELEQITYKLEFELELNELDAEWYDFLNEQIGDDFTQAVDTMDLITEKIKIANNNINLYKQSVTDLMENIENDPNRSLITGYLEDGVLTDEEAEILKEAYSGIIEQLSALAEAKTSAEELLVSIFEGYKERIDLDTTALEHYTSLLEHFGNVVDIVGQKQLGLSDQFMENMAKMRIQQSRDIMSAAQSELAAYEQIRAEAEEELARAREEGRTNDIDYWQQQLDEANTSIQEARDKLVTSFEDNLNAIADAFDKAVERIVQTFNDAVYAFGGLEGLSEDYSFIRENTELMAQDYEKIYELSKLNRNINKTLNDNNIIAGKQKMIELQKEINDLQASGAELSKYDLEYLQAKYELRLAEIELENAQNAKETVRLSKDSEGNWSYVYTASTEKIDEAQQKYEDALYKMQNLSYEYIDEMSEKIISTSQAMMEELQNLNKNNFESEQEYLAEWDRIEAKYAESIRATEEELNKSLANNEELRDKDWQSYSNKTGYAISESQNWIDRYAESTLGTLMKSTSDVADYMDNFSLALNELTNSLYRVARDYYNGIDDAFAAAGITKEDFASFVTTNTKAIMDASTNTKKDIETQTSTLVKEYSIQADKVTEVQRILDTAIDVYGPYIREIRDILKESAALTKEQQGKDATYTYQQAGELFNSIYGDKYKIEMDENGVWTKQVEGVKRDILDMHSKATTDEEKRYFADMYTWLTSYILPYVTSLDTGGYTGEWGTSGRLAMLHEKELILNANDTANFLDALNVSKELVNRVIEMNARASSFGIGGLSPSSIQDFAQNLEQQVTITAEFPNAVDHNEIEEAFASLINTASQYANRK